VKSKRAFVALGIGLLLTSCGGKPDNDRDLKAAFANSNLKDPSSVQLRNVQENSDVICGEYNSKNGYGAYGGFQPFVFQRAIKVLWLGDTDNDYALSSVRDVGKKCPNAAELGIASDVVNEATTDQVNQATSDSVNAADAALNATDDAVKRASEAVEKAQAQTNADSSSTSADPEFDNTADDPDNTGEERDNTATP
jgi:hypothetical protein